MHGSESTGLSLKTMVLVLQFAPSGVWYSGIHFQEGDSGLGADAIDGNHARFAIHNLL
jgi:hypothetical protein